MRSYLTYTTTDSIPLQGIGSGQRQLIAVTCIAEHALAATYTNAHALAKPQAEPCPMPSAAGKRVGRVLAGCPKPKAGDKPGSVAGTGSRSLLQPIPSSAIMPVRTHPESDASKEPAWNYSGHLEHFRWNLDHFKDSRRNGVLRGAWVVT